MVGDYEHTGPHTLKKKDSSLRNATGVKLVVKNFKRTIFSKSTCGITQEKNLINA